MLLTLKTYLPRHSREGGSPVKWLIKMDSRLRGNDGIDGFLELQKHLHWGHVILSHTLKCAVRMQAAQKHIHTQERKGCDD